MAPGHFFEGGRIKIGKKECGKEKQDPDAEKEKVAFSFSRLFAFRVFFWTGAIVRSVAMARHGRLLSYEITLI